MPAPQPNNDTDAVVRIVFFTVLFGTVAYFVLLFLAGSVGIVKQLANPAAQHDFNGTIVLWLAVPLGLFAYVATPEFGRDLGERMPVVLSSALVGLVCTLLATSFLGPSIARPSVYEHLAAAYLLFSTFSLLPTLVVVRLLTYFHADVVLARQGDHPIDTDQLTPETRRLIEKHCGKEMRRPPGWQPFTLWGDAGRITHADLQKVLAFETAQQKQLAELYRLLTPNEECRAAEDAFQELAIHKATTAREIAALRGEAERLRQAAEEASARDRAALKAAREEKRQALQELTHARAAAEDARAAVTRLEIALNDKAAAVRRATEALEDTKAAALREISRAKQEDRDTRALLDADNEMLLSAVAQLAHERAVADAKCEALHREAAATADATEHGAPARTTAAVAGASASRPKYVRPTPGLTLVVDNPSAQGPFSKSPERHGVPQRLWRRTQRTLRKGACE